MIIDKNTDKNFKTMADGSKAWLSSSGNYFVRREWHTPKGRNIYLQSYPWNHIVYYNKETKELIQLARVQCKLCDDVVYSRHCGDFRTCTCGKVSVDTDRWMPERHRYLGDPENYNVL